MPVNTCTLVYYHVHACTWVYTHAHGLSPLTNVMETHVRSVYIRVELSCLHLAFRSGTVWHFGGHVLPPTVTTYILDASFAALPPHLPTLLISLVFFTSMQLVVMPLVRPCLLPDTYHKMRLRVRNNNWYIHIVSQAPVLLDLNLKVLDRHCALGQEKDRVGWLIAISSGYFIWDTIDAIVKFVDIGFIVHGSTFFLSIHWFLNKTNHTGSTFQLINGLFLPVMFFIGLNCLWFGETIEAMRMRFFGDSEVKAHTTIGTTPKQNGYLQHRVQTFSADEYVDSGYRDYIGLWCAVREV
ncbi:hypothetical protein EDD18DRAFT_1109713 [Armillaria luteobubalina]|uniref:TLC domain-containing protein n=1 Tax=Armillaria luteobubalina TaxID=153913 RepID=A0AA39PTA7_9AGAR|nr:hypothetical protein EDD18DRAFT_1109713 [Armillaria luteobubalina]